MTVLLRSLYPDLRMGSSEDLGQSPSKVVTLLEIMKRFRLDLVLRVYEMLLESLVAPEGVGLEAKIDEHYRDEALLRLTMCDEQFFTKYGFSLSGKMISRLRRMLENPETTYAQLNLLVSDLHSRLIDEMETKFFFILDSNEAEHYKHPMKGWERVLDRFPQIQVDIEEATKCFAFKRYAAAVFHSLQIVESGVVELGKFIGVQDSKAGWSATTNQLQKLVAKKYSERNDFEKEHCEFFEQVHATVEALKNAWRNKISHVQGRLVLMTADFSSDVAEEILFASRAFMGRLATGLPSDTEDRLHS